MKNISEVDLSDHQQEKLFEAEKMDAVGGLVAGVSHEINTPLGVNIGNCTLLIELLENVKEQFAHGNLDADSFNEFLESKRSI